MMRLLYDNHYVMRSIPYRLIPKDLMKKEADIEYLKEEQSATMAEIERMRRVISFGA